MAWEETENQIKHRIQNPDDFREDTFRTKALEESRTQGVKGVSIILGKLRPDKIPKGHDPDSMVVQAYRWDKSEGWTMEKAQKWFEEHVNKDNRLEASLNQLKEELRVAQCRIRLAEALSESGLPPLARRKISRRFSSGVFSESQLQEALQEERDFLISISGGYRVRDDATRSLLYASTRKIGPKSPDEFVLIEPGEMVYTNQKPRKRVNYTPEMLRRIAANFARLGQEKVIDYEHQTLKGVKAPAAGWIKELLFDPERGLVARVKEWTKEAQGYLRNKEYRFISPVIDPHHIDTRTGENIGPVLHSVALTNDPLMYWLEPLVSKANSYSKEEDDEMELLKLLAKKLGLAEEASQEDVIQALDGLLAAKDRVALPEVLELLGAKADAKLEDIKPLVAKLKEPPAKAKIEPDPNLYVAKSEFDVLQGKLTAIENERREEKADKAVNDALLAGKLTPAQKEWALDYAKTNPAGFAAYVAKATQVVPLDQIVTGKGLKVNEIPDETQLLVNKQLGITQDDFQKYGQMAIN